MPQPSYFVAVAKKGFVGMQEASWNSELHQGSRGGQDKNGHLRLIHKLMGVRLGSPGGGNVVKNCSSEMDPPPPQFTHLVNSVHGPSFAGL